MWKILSATLNGKTSAQIHVSDGKPIDSVRGPAGASFRLIVTGVGFLDLTDMGHEPGGPHYWLIDINGQDYWYDGEGALSVDITSAGQFRVTGDGNSLAGEMKALPRIDKADLDLVIEMERQGLIPYRDDPNGHKTKQQLEALGKQFFPFSANSYELALSVYDWTTADFFRMDLFHLYRYVALPKAPLDMAQIASGIWTANWPPYVPSNADFMNSFMMKPAASLAEVGAQLDRVAVPLKTDLDALARVTAAAKYALPRVSTLSKPELYSGQVAISNLGESAFAVYFLEYPGNAGPVGTPMAMELEQALGSFMAPGHTLTLKSFISFTDSLQDAMHYQNGIVLKLRPPAGARTWGEGITYITPLSDEDDKIEYTFSPGARVRINSFEKQTVSGKEVVVIDMSFVGEMRAVPVFHSAAAGAGTEGNP